MLLCMDETLNNMRVLSVIILLTLASSQCPATTAFPPGSPVALTSADRVLVLAPHPDDEVLGCGGIIQQCVALKIPVHVVYLTYGDNNEWSFMIYRKHAVLFSGAARRMGQVRHTEAVAAAEKLGLETNQLTFLGYPDFGTLRIWIEHWDDEPPYESMLTRTTSVPYDNALRPGAAYRGEEIVKDLTSLFRTFQPTKIFVSHPADFNVDHRALYCFTRLTLWTMESEIQPAVFPYLVHFPRWPEPHGRHTDRPLKPPTFFDDDIVWRRSSLTPDWVAGKEKALQSHRSQFEYAAHYLESFIRTNELFGDFSDITFPSAGTSSLPAKVLLAPGAPPPSGRTR